MTNAKVEFVTIKDVCPSVVVEATYATKNNFTGSIVPGYKKEKALLTKSAAQALCLAQEKALKLGVSLKIFDAFRPVKAVSFFEVWSKQTEDNSELKELYYPKYKRSELFDLGYIAKKSSHSRGSTVDLTLIDKKSGKELDMGTIFDYFDELSWTKSKDIGDEQKKNRLMLIKLMEDSGFKNYEQEWWHFTLTKEANPDQYFDFDID